MVRIAIVDDVKKDAEIASAYIHRYFQECNKSCKVTYFSDGLFFLEDYRPVFDLVFLDIDMKFMDGMETARKLREKDPSIILIFMTNMAQYAAYGYDVDAIGYLVKPLDYYGMEMKLKKAVQMLDHRKEVHFIMNLTDENGTARKVISANDILYLEVRDHYVIVHTRARDYKIRSSLTECAERLTDAHFAFSSRFFLVNLMYVEAVKGDCVVINQTEVLLSRSMKKHFLMELTEYYGGN